MTTTADGRRLLIIRAPDGAPASHRVIEPPSAFPLHAGSFADCRTWIARRKQIDREATRRRLLAELARELAQV